MAALPRFVSPLLASTLGLVTMFSLAPRADAFCGFYVAGADTDLFANATMVVLMREGKRTVLSMRNDYSGPPEDFALVIPVPVVLGEEDVRTLDPKLFERVDKLAAPRLVEYWEQDPCQPNLGYGGLGLTGTGRGGGGLAEGSKGLGELGVKVEAEFEVEEYEVVILSAQESTGLDTWLRANDYAIPEGAEPLLRPYVEGGSKFFVAKVDADKVSFDAEGKATLSPLRFHYDSDSFVLPIRLGLINAPAGGGGKQDLLVHILAPKTRFDVANYPQATIPTNLEVNESVRDRFGEFYVSLFDHTVAEHPGAVVTEYAWSAGSCDPCPDVPLSQAELAALGADALPTYAKRAKQSLAEAKQEGGGGRRAGVGGLIGLGNPSGGGFASGFASEFVLTRLHARYDASSLAEDLVFESAPAIVGGRERPMPMGPDDPPPEVREGAPIPRLERGAQPAPASGFGGGDNFQARYIMRHPWTKAIECEEPVRGMWGGNPETGGAKQTSTARELAYVPRGGSLGSFVLASSAAQLGVSFEAPAAGPAPADSDPKPEPETAGQDKAAAPASEAETPATKPAPASGNTGCGCTSSEEPRGRGLGGLASLALIGLALRGRRRRELVGPGVGPG